MSTQRPGLPDPVADLDRTFREARGAATATLIRVFGDITLAEDAVQDAFVIAAERWPVDGVPPNPGGWIVTTARRRAIDTVRRSNRGRELELLAAAAEPASLPDPADMTEHDVVPDDQLRLLFTCCHPSLAVEHRIALTLRLLGRLDVDEIARSFLVRPAAMAKRLVRAKYKIAAARIPYRVPSQADLRERLTGVLTVIYLIANTGTDDPGRSELRAEAIRLARVLAELMPDEPEAMGLLALLLLSESRAEERRRDGEIVLLRDQDRTGWDRSMMFEGLALVRSCVDRDRPGPFQIQAAIQAVHATAPTFAETDWESIVALYDQLMTVAPTPIVVLNRAIAVAEVEGPARGLEHVDALADRLEGYPLMHASRGDLLERLGDLPAARSAFERARTLTDREEEVRYLSSRIERLM